MKTKIIPVLSFVLVLLLPTFVACSSSDKLEDSVRELVDSVAFDSEKDTLSFMIPDSLPGAYSFDIFVTGRVKMGDGGMSVHFFEDEMESGAWEPGKIYTQEFEPDSLLGLTMLVGAVRKSDSETAREFLYGTEININESGNIMYSTIDEAVSIPEALATAENSTSIIFPASDKGRTEFNAAVYDITPFTMLVALPTGWSLAEREAVAKFDADIALQGVWSVIDVYNADNERIGAVGYNTYEPYEGAEDEPQAIYNQIALGNDYHFDIRDSYAVVNETDSGMTATTDVYYSGAINNGTKKINKGILSYNRDLSVYIAMEFADGMIENDQQEAIAASIRLEKTSSPHDSEEPADIGRAAGPTVENSAIMLEVQFDQTEYTTDSVIGSTVTITNNSDRTMIFVKGSDPNSVPDALKYELGGFVPLYKPEIMTMDSQMDDLAPGETVVYQCDFAPYIPKDGTFRAGAGHSIEYFKSDDFTPAAPGIVKSSISFTYLLQNAGTSELSMYDTTGLEEETVKMNFMYVTIKQQG